MRRTAVINHKLHLDLSNKPKWQLINNFLIKKLKFNRLSNLDLIVHNINN